MDPNEALGNLRDLAGDFIQEYDLDEPDHVQLAELGVDIAQTFQGLDEWLCSKRGFLPDAWQRS